VAIDTAPDVTVKFVESKLAIPSTEVVAVTGVIVTAVDPL
jgi:hypothetical protein